MGGPWSELPEIPPPLVLAGKLKMAQVNFT
jgi:hypothetical protein